MRLFGATLTILVLLTATTLWIARDRIAREEERALEREFDAAIAALRRVQDLRKAAIIERCRTLAQRSRIHAAIEDGALDLLYPSARDELRDALTQVETGSATAPHASLGGRFYRFLGRDGRVIVPAQGDDFAGPLTAVEEARLALPAVPRHPTTGYIPAASGGGVHEVFVTPIISTATGEPMAALALGFSPLQLSAPGPMPAALHSGILVGSTLHLPTIAAPGRASVLTALLEREFPTAGDSVRFPCEVEGESHLVFLKGLNPESPYPPGVEVALFPLAAMEARQRRVSWQISAVAGVLLVVGFTASRLLATRFTRPVEQLALDSAEQRRQRQQVEAALETTSAELERAARFSADASHQLKTPVTVLRAGLEEMLARAALPESEAEEVAALIHQTYRLSGVIDVLLLLSRMDARQLKITFGAVDLRSLVEASLDDVGAAPDGLELAVDSDLTGDLRVAGERRYIALILQNLLENARKYNRPGGRIQVNARHLDGAVIVTVGNTTRRPIPPHAREHIFERFHRGAAGEDVPGYGIGLNLARQLAHLHEGDLRLLRSDEDWTEFEVRFRSLPPTPSDSA